MADKNTHDPKDSREQQPAQPLEQLDASGRSLSDALRLSFGILKVIMIVLIVAFFASGFKTVGPNEQALVLRFGKILGSGDEADPRVLGPGPHWILPYPIDEMVRIPVEEQINLSIPTFWHRETRDDIIGQPARPRDMVPEVLNPMLDGYNLTRSYDTPTQLAQGLSPTETEASDYSIVHTRWQVVYQIGNIEQFFTQVYVEDVRPGQVYLDVMKNWVTPLLQSVVEDAVVNAMAQYSIDQALQSTDTIRRHVRRLVQQKLDDIDSGIQVTSVQLVRALWPRQVNAAFEAFITASQESGRAISEARTYAENTLNEAAGRMAQDLYRAVMAESADPNQLDLLWSQVAGRTQNKIAEAGTYRTRVVASAEANARYLESILPEFKERPDLVVQQLYLDAIDEVLRNADEKFVVQPSNEEQGQEIRVLVNRDATLPPRRDRGPARMNEAPR